MPVYDQISGVEPSLQFFPHPRSSRISHNPCLAIKYRLQGCERVSHCVAMTGPNLHLDSTIGCFFVGMVLAIVCVHLVCAYSIRLTLCSHRLYGCTCAQVLYYYWQYPEDRIHFKSFVSLLAVPAESMLTRLSQFKVLLLWSVPYPALLNSATLTVLYYRYRALDTATTATHIQVYLLASSGLHSSL